MRLSDYNFACKTSTSTSALNYFIRVHLLTPFPSEAVGLKWKRKHKLIVTLLLCMVWYGMIWYHGIAWYGVWFGVWYGNGMMMYSSSKILSGMVHGMVWHSMVWYGMLWHGMVCYSMAFYGMVYDLVCDMVMVWCIVVRYCMVRYWYGMVRYSIPRHCMVWYGILRYGMVWYAIVCHTVFWNSYHNCWYQCILFSNSDS